MSSSSSAACKYMSIYSLVSRPRRRAEKVRAGEGLRADGVYTVPIPEVPKYEYIPLNIRVLVILILGKLLHGQKFNPDSRI